MSHRPALIVGVAWVLVLAACGSQDSTQTSTAASTTTATTTTATTAPTTTPPPTTATTEPTTTTTTTTTTAAPDVTPPELVVTDPQPGATVTTGTYRFSGATEPGCTVIAAGRYQADVDEDGNWSIVLVLNEGGNVATFTATDEAGNTTTTRIPLYYEPAAPHSDFYSLTGGIPTTFPGTPLAIAFATLEGGVGGAANRLIAEFGEPEREGLEGGRWDFAGESWIGWFEDDEWAFYARANPQDGLRLALYEGLVLGASTVADLTSRWGEPLHVNDNNCPVMPRDEACLNIVYSLGNDEIRFSWRTTAAAVAPEWVLERIWISDYWWPMMFIGNGAVSSLGTISEHCDERGCRVHSDSSYWASEHGVTPFYSWGADCLDATCEYVGIFIGTTPPADVPIAERWKVQTSHAIGGLLLARTVSGGAHEVIGTTFARQSSDQPLIGPSQDSEVSHIYWYVETSDRERCEAWQIDLQALTITRLVCDGPNRSDCRPVWE